MMSTENPDVNTDMIGSYGKNHYTVKVKKCNEGHYGGYGHHERGDDERLRLIVKGDFVNKLSTDLMCRGINANNLTELVCACLFRNHIFKHLMVNRYNDPNRYDLDCEILKFTCHLTKSLACSKTTLRFLVRLNDLTFPMGCRLADCDWNLIKKRIKLSSFDIRAIWLGCHGDTMDTLNIGLLINVYQSMKCRKMISKNCSESQIKEYFQNMTNDQKIKKIFMIALDCWVNSCDTLDNVMPSGTILSCLSYDDMCKSLDDVFKSKNPEFRSNMTRPLTFNADKYTPREREHLNKWLCNPANTSPTMPVIIALIQSVGTGKWCDFYGRLENPKTKTSHYY